jgi:hypothetical protein
VDDLWTLVRTEFGMARVQLVDRWLAVAACGDLLERDVWDVRFETGGVAVVRRMRTFPEPTPEALRAAVGALLRSVDANAG